MCTILKRQKSSLEYLEQGNREIQCLVSEIFLEAFAENTNEVYQIAHQKLQESFIRSLGVNTEGESTNFSVQRL